MGLTQIIAKIHQISLNETNGCLREYDKYKMYKNGYTIYKDNIGHEIGVQFETLFMSNDMSHAIITSIGGNRFCILLE
jgi:hypothetical protein